MVKQRVQKPKIQVSGRLKKFLDNNAIRKGESYEEIIWRLLGQKTLTKEQKQEVKAGYESSL